MPEDGLGEQQQQLANGTFLLNFFMSNLHTEPRHHAQFLTLCVLGVFPSKDQDAKFHNVEWDSCHI